MTRGGGREDGTAAGGGEEGRIVMKGGKQALKGITLKETFQNLY